MLYYRRRLPHWVPDDTVIFVTSWLAGSSPPSRPEILTGPLYGGLSLTGPLDPVRSRDGQLIQDKLTIPATDRVKGASQAEAPIKGASQDFGARRRRGAGEPRGYEDHRVVRDPMRKSSAVIEHCVSWRRVSAGHQKRWPAPQV